MNGNADVQLIGHAPVRGCNRVLEVVKGGSAPIVLFAVLGGDDNARFLKRVVAHVGCGCGVRTLAIIIADGCAATAIEAVRSKMADRELRTVTPVVAVLVVCIVDLDGSARGVDVSLTRLHA